MIHLSLLFLDGNFETTPDYGFTDSDILKFLPYFPVLKAQDMRSSSRKPSREIEMPRNTRENMSILGHVFDRQHAQRDPDELHTYWRNLATPSGIADDVKDSEKRRNWEKCKRRTTAINTFYFAFSVREKKSRRQISPMSMTNHALGIWTCTQVAWPFRVISTRRCICKIP